MTIAMMIHHLDGIMCDDLFFVIFIETIIFAIFSAFGKYLSTVKLGDKERFDNEQIGVKEPFPMTNCQFTS